jgi:hypothetical protein
MVITRALALGSLIALNGATSLAPGYAAEPCCGWVGGKYVNLKTGKVALPPKDAHAPTGPVGTAKPEQEDVIMVIGPMPEPKRATNR